MVWNHPWPTEITDEFISKTNPRGNITNLDLKLSTLVLQDDILLSVTPKAVMSVN